MKEVVKLEQVKVDLSGITTDMQGAFIYLKELLERGKPEKMVGYRPFKLVGHESGFIELACLPDHAEEAGWFVRGYLSDIFGNIRKGLEKIHGPDWYRQV